MHVLPQLRKLADQFPDVLAVIGVHSPKFTAEREFANLRQAVMRYDIRHPVVSDDRHVVWDSYAVSAWPTSVFVDPDGRVIGQHPGEFDAADYSALIQALTEDFDAQGKLDRSPLPISLEREKEPVRTLDFPGKVLTDPAAGRLFIADTGHHRILVVDTNGHIQTVIGSGEPGLDDGDFESATFRNPQGMAVDGNALYVADLENHSIRRADLADRRVVRIAGTGEQLRLPRRGGPALSSSLTSPWDLALGDGMLYIAMAGNHQIWALDLNAEQVSRFSGTGREALGDGTLQRCALAQPSGLSLSGSRLYFADSETSAVRVADIEADRVETIVGEGLFDFGDRDGEGDTVRLQHCLGISACDGMIYVADTYNNKIKRIDPSDRSSHTFLGTGEAGRRDGPGETATFWEPGGVCASDGQLYIADTNNHCIRVTDLATREVRTLEIEE